MPELDQFVIADGATPNANGTYDIFGASWDAIIAAELPVEKPTLVLLISVLLTREEAQTAHEMQVEVSAPNGTVMSRVRVGVAAGSGEQPPGIPEGLPFRFETVLTARGLQLAEYGRYPISMTWDGEPLRAPTGISVLPPPPDQTAQHSPSA